MGHTNCIEWEFNGIGDHELSSDTIFNTKTDFCPMNISLDLRALEETPKRFFQYVRDEGTHPESEFSGRTKGYEQSRLRDFIQQCLLIPKRCLICRRWAYQTQQTTEFLLRPSPDCMPEDFEDSTLAFVCRMNDDGTLEIIAGESRSGPADERFEKLFDGYLTIASHSIWEQKSPTDEEGRLFLRYLPEVGADLNKPLAAWTNYLDWRQKLAEQKANERYAYRAFKAGRGQTFFDFHLTKPTVQELLKTRLSGETIRVFASDDTPGHEQEERSDHMETRKRPLKAKFEGAFRSVRSAVEEHPTRGRGRYNLRHDGKPKGDPEELIVRLTVDPDDERQGFSISDMPDCGVLKAAMEGELAAVDVQRNGLKRLAEYQGLNPNVRQWLFNHAAAKPLAGALSEFQRDLRLNDEQLECVKKALAFEDLLLLWGPPGTGKTTVIAEIASQYCRLRLRVLISSQANLAVDQALERLPKLPHIRPARVSTSKQKNKLGIDVRSGMLWWLAAVAKQVNKDLKSETDPRWHQLMKGWRDHLSKVAPADLSEPCIRHYKARANVIGATCLETGKPDFYNSKEFDAKFDLSIVDEVSKATPPELLLPALIGLRTILVGDHRQLPPVFRDSTFPEAIENGDLSEEEFDRFKGMVTASLFQKMFETCDPSIRTGLRQQYRMHPQIMAAVNRFYADQPLSAGGGHEQLAKDKAHSFSLTRPNGTPWLKPGQHLVWIDSTFDDDGKPVQDERIGTSRLNDAEASLGVELLRALLPKTESIGFISLYRAQIQNIETLLREESDPLLRTFLDKKGVNTVDQFQGSEREVIIVSLTRTDPHLTGEFVKDFRRINVAISRAKKLLILIGRNETFDSGMVEVPAEAGKGTEARSVYKEIREIAQKTGLYISLQAVMPARNDKQTSQVSVGQRKQAVMPRNHDKQTVQASVAQHKPDAPPCINEPKTLKAAFEGLDRHFPTLKQPRSR